jgi:peptidoglycan/LPS O-acetylase OafA/YrhL
MAETGRPRLQVLDLLRIFAACSVMFFHLAYWSWANPRSRGADILQGAATFPELAPYSSWGWVSVDIFFVISGFVISYSAANASFRSFVRSRFLRLFPSILICSAITLAIFLATDLAPVPKAIEAFWKTVVIWPFGGWLDGVYWTLAVELTFYIVVALFLLLGRPSWLGAAMALIGLVTTFLAASAYLSGSGAPSISGVSKELSDSLLLRHGMYFSLGYFIWSATNSGWTPVRSALVVVFLIGGAFPILAAADSLSRIPGSSPAWVPLMIWLAAVLVMLASVTIVAPKRHQPTRRWLALLGMATFPLYLIHYVAGATLMALLIRNGWQPTLALPATCIVMMVGAVALTVLIEAGPRQWIASVIDTVFQWKNRARPATAGETASTSGGD